MTVAPKSIQVIRASVSPVPSAASTSLWVASFAMKPKSRPPVNAAMYQLPCKLCATEKQAMASPTTVTCFHISVNEIGFRWDHRIPEIKITKIGKKKKYMQPMPFMARLISLLSRCAGRQVRKTRNCGITSFENCSFGSLQPYFCS